MGGKFIRVLTVREGKLPVKMHDLELMRDMRAFHRERLFDADGNCVANPRVPIIRFYQLTEDGITPERNVSNNSWDLHNSAYRLFIAPGTTSWISTNVAVRVPKGFLLWIRPFTIFRPHTWSGEPDAVFSQEAVMAPSRSAEEIRVRVSNTGLGGFMLEPFQKLGDFHLLASPDVGSITL